MTTIIAIDTNVLVAIIDARDKWHGPATAIQTVLMQAGAQLVYFDVVVNEAIGVIGRRTEEQKRSADFDALLTSLLSVVPPQAITWLSAASERLFPAAVSLCRAHAGAINLNDALIALACRELDIPFLLSYDVDFDQISGITRLADAQSAREVLLS